jgi:hypothetical protein
MRLRLAKRHKVVRYLEQSQIFPSQLKRRFHFEHEANSKKNELDLVIVTITQVIHSLDGRSKFPIMEVHSEENIPH